MAEQLANNEMPPKDKPQPTPADKERLSAWVDNVLEEVSKARAGDPGPVVLRRLSNAEYTYTIRDLTGVPSLDPAREFPIDGAAGEGFMNTGNALVMSPSLITKYLDAGKNIATHAVLLPDGLRFSAAATRRDLTEEMLVQIRGFYREFTDPRGGDKVNLQGIIFQTNEGGRLPLEKYLAATLAMRTAGKSDEAAIARMAQERGLSPKYLGILWKELSGSEPSQLLDRIRTRWQTAKPEDVAGLTTEIAQWQKVLWKFSSVGHIGKAGGPKAWMEPASPLTSKQEVRLKLPATPDAKEITLYLVAGDAGDGNANDYVVWQQPRLVAAGKPNLLLRDVQEVSRELAKQREQTFSTAAKSLAAASEATSTPGHYDAAELASKHGVEATVLKAWLEYLGIGSGSELKITGYFTNTFNSASGYDFIKGWGPAATPNLTANSSTQHVRIPGNMKAHGVAVHPSPKLQAAVGWLSPLASTMRIQAKVTHAHPECGNGVTWSLELRRGGTRQRLAAGTAQGSKEVQVGPIEKIAVQKGDLISLLIGPRGDHSCDLTDVELSLKSSEDNAREWNLNQDISPDVLAGNPHADRFGNEGIWHFYTEPVSGGSETGPVIPSGSLLARWQSAEQAEEKSRLADEVQKLLTSGPPAGKDNPDAALYRQLASLNGPLFAGAKAKRDNSGKRPQGTKEQGLDWGLDAAAFGKHPNGAAKVDADSICVRAPSLLEIRLPADLVAGCEFVTTGVLESKTGAEGSVQLQVLTNKPSMDSGLFPSSMAVTEASGPWTSYNRRISHSTPILANEGSAARKRIEAGFEEFRQLFPAALCYTKIVPVDEVVTLTLYYREDDQLARLMLNDAQKAKLDRLWDELHYISQDALTLVDAFEQLWQFATQDADPKVFEPLRKPIQERAAAFRQLLVDTQPKHVEAVLALAGRAYRRPLADGEAKELRGLYQKLRAQELSHEEAIRLTLARVFTGPAFLYHLEKAGPGAEPAPISDWELANRLSYFLWSSMPDEELKIAAAQGTLRSADGLAAQTKRMLRDPRARRLAIEFACQWLHIRDFDTLDEKSERHFPTFIGLRGDMYEESIRFLTDLFQRDGSVLNLLDADYTFLNEPLAKHYGVPGVKGAEWRRVDGIKKYSRGGILAQATTLAKQSGASRTSPILRGNWVAEVLLGDKLPRPPKDVPKLPDDEAALAGLTVRQLVEKHSSDPRCYGCHRRIDPFGYSLENFDAIGRWREKDLGDRPIDTRVKAMDGAELDGIEGLRRYLLTKKQDVFLKQFCRKLLGYSLGRAVQLSDGPLLTQIRDELKRNNYQVGTAVEMIVKSRQFREIRGRDGVYED
ncbi:MAG: cytochrome [Verrucomicrobiales bacterium]|nr:cytochrome [Verrucomicrobiales bacterium]